MCSTRGSGGFCLRAWKAWIISVGRLLLGVVPVSFFSVKSLILQFQVFVVKLVMFDWVMAIDKCQALKYTYIAEDTKR